MKTVCLVLTREDAECMAPYCRTHAAEETVTAKRDGPLGKLPLFPLSGNNGVEREAARAIVCGRLVKTDGAPAGGPGPRPDRSFGPALRGSEES